MPIHEILNWPNMKRNYATEELIKEIAPFGINFTLKRYRDENGFTLNGLAKRERVVSN